MNVNRDFSGSITVNTGVVLQMHISTIESDTHAELPEVGEGAFVAAKLWRTEELVSCVQDVSYIFDLLCAFWNVISVTKRDLKRNRIVGM